MKRATRNEVIYLTHPTFNFERFIMRVVVALSRAGLSYYDLAFRTNLGHTTIARIMGQRSKNMMVGTVSKIAQALHISADYLLDVRAARTVREREIENEAQYNLKFRGRRANIK